ncbi:hypothetical protein CRUP_020977, partial [Coryphaenoides rupestris]
YSAGQCVRVVRLPLHVSYPGGNQGALSAPPPGLQHGVVGVGRAVSASSMLPAVRGPRPPAANGDPGHAPHD